MLHFTSCRSLKCVLSVDDRTAGAGRTWRRVLWAEYWAVRTVLSVEFWVMHIERSVSSTRFSMSSPECLVLSAYCSFSVPGSGEWPLGLSLIDEII